MSEQVWLKCHKQYVERVRLWLGQNLSRKEKIRSSKNSGWSRWEPLQSKNIVELFSSANTWLEYVLVPTALFEHDDFDLAEALICQQGAFGPVEIVLLPVLESKTFQNVGILHVAVCHWLETLSGHQLQPEEIAALTKQSPVRWSSYPPMLLLPAGSFQTEAWTSFLLGTTAQQRDELWESLLSSVSRKDGGPRLTHLAVNSGIPLCQETSETENLFRSPSGLVMLYGDFGPCWRPTESVPTPSQEDFDLAFWVSIKQNGIYQTWAPRYTMFSRGNIKEKARILSFRSENNIKIGPRDDSPVIPYQTAIDLYAGIGYFVFSYATILSRVLCWEINPWSVEGLRRGSKANGWKIRIVRHGDDLSKPAQDLVENDDKIVVFEESNECALTRLRELLSSANKSAAKPAYDVVHINCGFLPTSEPTWKMALELVSKMRGGWLHLHENVAFKDIEERRAAIQRRLRTWASESDTTVEVIHAELVKTFAPDVWHCVFDVAVVPTAR